MSSVAACDVLASYPGLLALAMSCDYMTGHVFPNTRLSHKNLEQKQV